MPADPKTIVRARKLIELALDKRGSKHEADAAGLKAIRLLREQQVSLDDFVSACAPPPADPVPVWSGPDPDVVIQKVGEAFAQNVQETINDVFKDLRRATRQFRV